MTERRRRRAVAYSPQDAERVRRGEPTLEEAEAERRRGVDALTDVLSHDGGVLGRESGTADHANDARLLHDVPPHWG